MFILIPLVQFPEWLVTSEPCGSNSSTHNHILVQLPLFQGVFHLLQDKEVVSLGPKAPFPFRNVVRKQLVQGRIQFWTQMLLWAVAAGTKIAESCPDSRDTLPEVRGSQWTSSHGRYPI